MADGLGGSDGRDGIGGFDRAYGPDEFDGLDGLGEEDGDFDWSADEEVFFLDGDEDGGDWDEGDGLGHAGDSGHRPATHDLAAHGRATASGIGGTRGDTGWPNVEHLQGGRDSGRPDRRLPPIAPQSRVLAPLLALAVFLGAVGGAFTAAYHRHVTDRRIADTLELAATDTAPKIPGLAALSFQSLWQADLKEQVIIPVTNLSPEPVVLLNAVLEEPGMTASAEFAPFGAARLAPGQTGEVGGEVTVDCTQDPGAVFPYMDGSDGAAVMPPHTTALLVRARTEGGLVGEDALEPDADGPDLQLRICQQEGFDITGPPTVYAIGHAQSRSVEISLFVASSADITLEYRATVAYAKQSRYAVADPPDTAAPQPLLPATGTVQPGAMIHVSFTIQVLHCPIHPQPAASLYVELMLTARGNPVDALEESTSLALPLTTACGVG